MTERHIAVRPLASALGAEITGLDLSRPLGDAVFAAVKQAFLDHLVVFFPDQDLAPEHLVGFARRFGPIGIYPFAEPLAGHPEVIPVIKEPEQKTNFGGAWHSDTAYLEAPPLGTLLYAKQVPALGGDTLFANMYLAYETLSDGLKALLDGMTAINSAAKNQDALRGDHLKTGAMRARADSMDPAAELWAEHPVVRRHPETGRPALYVNRAHTTAFSEMSEAESAPLLDYLFGHAVREEFTCRFRWRAGSLALWDNRCALHYPLNDYHGERRVMHRVTIQGDRPR